MLARTFRVFVSSPFTEQIAAERRQLRRLAFDPLARECARRGVHFQPVDLRWGISPQASHDQRTMDVCLGEVERCRQASPELNFLYLGARRRGWLPVPTTVPHADMERLRGHFTGHERLLVDRWYQLDLNALPHAYRLMPRTGPEQNREAWRQTEETLHQAFAHASQNLDPRDRGRYRRSATEQEVDAALPAEGPAPGMFAVMNAAGDAPAWELDEYVRARVDPGQVFDRDPATTPEAVAGIVHTWFLERIEHTLATGATVPALVAVPGTGPGTGPDLVARGRELARLAAFADEPGPGLMTVDGEAGTGKTALITAACASSRSPGTLTVLRLLGTGPRTSDLLSVLKDLVHELAVGLGGKSRPLVTYDKTVEAFHELLEQADRPVRLYIDALDQLSDVHRPHDLLWLPDPLPRHVRIVLSTRDARSLRGSSRQHQHLRLTGLSRSDGARLLRRWLGETGRTLQPGQAGPLLDAFAVEGRPLWMRLAVQEAGTWTSQQVPAGLPPQLDALITRLYERLSAAKAHGPALVGRALGLLAASGAGLTEQEMLDALSHDATVMGEARSRSHARWQEEIDEQPPQVPTVLWALLRSDLQAYLTTRDDDGLGLLSFFHRELTDQAARTRPYAEDPSLVHASLAEMFWRRARPGGTWQTGDPRALQQIVVHLIASGQDDRQTEVLTDPQYLECAAEAVGVSEAADDQGFRRFGGVRTCAGRLAELNRARGNTSGLPVDLADALRAETDLLELRPGLFWQQIAGRMRFGPPAAVEWVKKEEERRAGNGERWLEPVVAHREPRGLEQMLRAHPRGSSCGLSEDAKLLVTGSYENSAHLWDARNGTWLASLGRHGSRVSGCAVTGDPDAPAIVTVERDGVIRRRRWDGLRAVALDQVRLPLAGRVQNTSFGHGETVAVTDGHACHLWRPGWEETRALPGTVLAQACSVARSSPTVVVGTLDGRLHRYDLADGTQVRAPHQQAYEIRHCAVDSEGRRVLTGGRGGEMQLWTEDLRPDGPSLPRFDTETAIGLLSLAVDDDFRIAVAGLMNGIVLVYDLRERSLVAASKRHGLATEGVTISPDGRLAASIGQNGVALVWRPQPDAVAEPEDTYSHAVQLIEFFDDARTVVVLDAYGYLHTVEAETGRRRGTVLTARDICMDATRVGDVIVTLENGGTIHRHLMNHGEPQPLPDMLHPGAEHCCAVGADQVATDAPDGQVVVWDVRTGRPRHRLAAGPGRVRLAGADGLLLVAGSAHLDLFDTGTGRAHRLELPEPCTTTAAHLERVGDAHVAAIGTADGRVLTWWFRQGWGAAIEQDGRHGAQVLRLAGGPADRPITSAGWDGRIGQWGTSGGQVRWLEGHAGPVRCAHPAGADLLVSAADDKTVRIWAGGRQIGLLPMEFDAAWAQVHRPTGLLVAGDQGGNHVLFRMRPEDGWWG
ncbi:NACHT domain-containing protein [Kineosporia corallincola]|nr:NACHT domain-containing protein [Kineosporia corallincola]